MARWDRVGIPLLALIFSPVKSKTHPVLGAGEIDCLRRKISRVGFWWMFFSRDAFFGGRNDGVPGRGEVLPVAKVNRLPMVPWLGWPFFTYQM